MMKFNAAIGISCLGIALLLCEKKKRLYRYLYYWFSSIVGLIGLITLTQSLFNYNAGIDELFIADNVTHSLNNSAPGRMAVTTALSFVFMSVGLLSLRSEQRLVRKLAQHTFHLVSLISFLAIIGYIYNVPGLYKLSSLAGMAAHSAIILFMLSVSASLINPGFGITGLFTGDKIGNIMARKFFPIVTVFLIILGYLRIESYRMGFVNEEFGIALYSTSFLLVCLLIISNTAKHLNVIDTERSEAENALVLMNNTLEERVKERTRKQQISEEKFYKAFHMSPAGMVLTDINTGTYIEMNQSFCELTGFSEQEALGKTSLELGIISHEQKEANNAIFKKEGYIRNSETCYSNKQGHKKTALVSVEVIALDDKKYALLIMYDITQIKETERQLMEAKKTAEAASVAKERFLANMSHEIRTPLNAIIGFTNLINKDHLDPKDRDYLHYIQASGENLLVLTNDILDYSKIEAGMMNLEKVPFKISELLDSMEMMFSAKAIQKKLKLQVVLDENIPPVMKGDAKRLTQILINLLGNAFKFTDQGGVYIRVSLLSLTGNNAMISISVKDTGVGIPADKLSQVFDRFVQASAETTRSFGGSGLGLAIVQNLVHLQGGEIVARSAEGAGSEFIVRLPYEVQEGVKINSDPPPVTKTLTRFAFEIKVLLCEDNRMNQMLAKEVLSRYGCIVDIAENGAIAIEMAAREHYDIVLMDIQMPVMDGYKAAEMIRKELNLTLPIIAMTADVMPGEREKCISFGMNDYLSKPFKQEDLYNTILKYVEVRSKKMPA